MRLAPVAMASVQASRFPSFPSTPAQAQPATQARTGKLIFPSEGNLNIGAIYSHLGDAFSSLVRTLDNNFDVIATFSKKSKKKGVADLQFYLSPQTSNTVYVSKANVRVSLTPRKRGSTTQAISDWETRLMSTVVTQKELEAEKLAKKLPEVGALPPKKSLTAKQKRMKDWQDKKKKIENSGKAY